MSKRLFLAVSPIPWIRLLPQLLLMDMQCKRLGSEGVSQREVHFSRKECAKPNILKFARSKDTTNKFDVHVFVVVDPLDRKYWRCRPDRIPLR